MASTQFLRASVLRKALSDNHIHLTHQQALELCAAACGHDSHASYRTDPARETSLAGAHFLLIDDRKLTERLAALGARLKKPIASDRIAPALPWALYQLRGAAGPTQTFLAGDQQAFQDAVLAEATRQTWEALPKALRFAPGLEIERFDPAHPFDAWANAEQPWATQLLHVIRLPRGRARQSYCVSSGLTLHRIGRGCVAATLVPPDPCAALAAHAGNRPHAPGPLLEAAGLSPQEVDALQVRRLPAQGVIGALAHGGWWAQGLGAVGEALFDLPGITQEAAWLYDYSLNPESSAMKKLRAAHPRGVVCVRGDDLSHAERSWLLGLFEPPAAPRQARQRRSEHALQELNRLSGDIGQDL